MNSCQGTLFIDSCLTTERPATVVPSIVQTGIQEIVTLSGIGAVEGVLQGFQRTVVVRIDGIGMKMQRALLPTNAGT